MKFPSIDTYHLIVFYFVATEQSITQAAEKLCLTQPTVTNHIKSLEESIHVKLIGIHRKRVTVTPAAEGLLQYAREIYRQASSAERYLELFKGATLSIGVSPFFDTVVAPAIYAISEGTYSATKLNIKTANAYDLIQEVVESRLDLVILPSLDYGFRQLTHIRVSDGIQLVVYASPDNPVFTGEVVEWQDLCNYPFITGPEPSPWQKIISSKLKAEGITANLQVDVTTNSLEVSKKLVQNGKNLSVALLVDIEKEVADGKLKIVTLPGDILIGVDAIIRSSNIIPPIIDKLLSLLKESFLGVTHPKTFASRMPQEK